MKKTAWAIFIFIAFLFPKSCFAVSVNITNFPNTITEEPFTICASISGASSGTNYLRIDIFKDQSSSYFGETFNGTDWYGGSTYSQYLPVVIEKGIWSGDVKGRVGNIDNYELGAQYKIRVRRYTSGGGYSASEANNNTVNISLALPTSTPSPTPVPTQSPTNTPTPTPKPTATNTPTPTLKPTVSISKLPTISIKLTQTVLAKSTPSGESKVLKEQDKTDNKKTETNYAKIFIAFGLAFLIACAILIILKLRKED